MTGGGHKLVLHTTESPREWIDGAIKQFTAGNGTPHLSIGWRKGFKFPVVAQFLPFDQYAKTLEHPPGRRRRTGERRPDRDLRPGGGVARLGRELVQGAREPAAAHAAPCRLPGEVRRARSRATATRARLDQGEGDRRSLPRAESAAGAYDPGRFASARLLRFMRQGKQELAPR
jgi:hypothetical protein